MSKRGGVSARASEVTARKSGGHARRGNEFTLLSTGLVQDNLPRDRSGSASFSNDTFERFVADIAANGQNDAITVRQGANGFYEIAAGRRRLEACRRLGIDVLARVRELDDREMLLVQYAENEQRENVSTIERAFWLAEIKKRMPHATDQTIARDLGMASSSFSKYIRIAAFPTSVVPLIKDLKLLTLNVSKQVVDAIEEHGPGIVDRIVSTLEKAPKLIEPTEQISLMMRAARAGGIAADGRSTPERFLVGGQLYATLSRDGRATIARFSAQVPVEKVRRIVKDLAQKERTSRIRAIPQ